MKWLPSCLVVSSRSGHSLCGGCTPIISYGEKCTSRWVHRTYRGGTTCRLERVPNLFRSSLHLRRSSFCVSVSFGVVRVIHTTATERVKEDPWDVFLQQLHAPQGQASGGSFQASTHPSPTTEWQNRNEEGGSFSGESTGVSAAPSHRSHPLHEPSSMPARSLHHHDTGHATDAMQAALFPPSGASSTSTSPSHPSLPSWYATTSLLREWANTTGPLFCTRLSECHVIASALWYRHIEEEAVKARTVGSLHQSSSPSVSSCQKGGAIRAAQHLRTVLRWWDEISHRIFLPRDVQSIEDVSLFLSTVLQFRPPSSSSDDRERKTMHTQRVDFTDGELTQLQEWILLHTPPSPSSSYFPPPPSFFRPPSSSAASDPLLPISSSRSSFLTEEKRHERPSAATHQSEEAETRSAKDARDTHAGAMIDPWEAISYTRLLGLLQSYVRYHRGVMWGVGPEEASLGGKSASPRSTSSHPNRQEEKYRQRRAKAAFYKRRYHLHPWDGMYCPEGTTAQRPYVDVLQWMQTAAPPPPPTVVPPSHPAFHVRGERERTTTQAQKESWQRWVSTFPKGVRGFHAPFLPPTACHSSEEEEEAEKGGSAFTAVDVCAQSGFAVDLLLKAGASHVLAVDTSVLATANTEATYREHQRDRRSGGHHEAPSSRRVAIATADVLPAVHPSHDLPAMGRRRGVGEATSSRLRVSSDKSFSPLGGAACGAAVVVVATAGKDGEGEKTTTSPAMRGTSRVASVGTTSADAAHRRRQAARQWGQKLAAHQERAPPQWTALPEEEEEDAGKEGRGGTSMGSATAEATDSIFRSPASFPTPERADVLWYHPPVPSTVLPFTIPLPTPSASSSMSLWRAHVEEEVRRQCVDRAQWKPRKGTADGSCGVPAHDGGRPTEEEAIASSPSPCPFALSTPPTWETPWYVLPWIAFPTLSARHPHHSHRVLQALLDTTLETTSSSVAPSGANRAARAGVGLKAGGFLLFLLPRSYTPLEEMLAALERNEKGEASLDGVGEEEASPPPRFASSPTLRAGPGISPASGSSWEVNATLWSAMGCVSDTLCAACTVPSSSSHHRASPGWHWRRMRKEWACVAFQRYAAPLEEEWKGAGDGGASWTWKCLCVGVPSREEMLSHWKACTPPQWVDLVVLQRTSPTAGSGSSSSSCMAHGRGPEATHRSRPGSPPFPAVTASTVAWEESLEYDEYLPATLPTHYHWTDQLPTFSYLEDDFLDRRPLAATNGVSLAVPASIPAANVLAHGPMSMERLQRTRAGIPTDDDVRTREAGGAPVEEERDGVPVSAWKADADAAAANFQWIFREELKKKRRTNKKFKQMALSSSRDQQEWYIDEKLVQSEAAKVEWMNQLNRFNFQQDFDH